MKSWSKLRRRIYHGISFSTLVEADNEISIKPKISPDDEIHQDPENISPKPKSPTEENNSPKVKNNRKIGDNFDSELTISSDDETNDLSEQEIFSCKNRYTKIVKF